MERLNLDKSNLRKFGVTMGIAFLLIGLIFSIKHNHIILPVFIISLVFFILVVIMPGLLNPIYIIWMRLAFVLSWVNTRLILSIMFYLVFTPIGLMIKLFGVDPLNRKIDKDKKSYWHKKEEKRFNPLDYERQF